MVAVMSADDGKSVVMKGVTHGACDYLIKPVRIEALKNIWQHVVRKKKNEWKDAEQSGSAEEGDRQPKASDEADYSSSANEGSWRNSKKRRDEEEEAEDRDDTSTLKKPRVVWSVELHQQFVAAVDQLGIDSMYLLPGFLKLLLLFYICCISTEDLCNGTFGAWLLGFLFVYCPKQHFYHFGLQFFDPPIAWIIASRFCMLFKLFGSAMLIDTL